MAAIYPDTVRIVLVEDHHLVREGLSMLIDSRPGFRVVGEAGDSAEGLALVARERPDVVLLDLDLGGEDGLELLPKLLDASENSSVIVLTGVRDPEVHLRAAGQARATATKSDVPEDVVDERSDDHREHDDGEQV